MLPETTKVFETRVPPQKNLAGLKPVCNKATIHGKPPRGNSCPRTINPDLLFEIPQMSASLRDLLFTMTEDSDITAHKAITTQIFFLNIFCFEANSRLIKKNFIEKKPESLIATKVLVKCLQS